MGWNEDTSDTVVAAALSRAHDIRQFEIELYWKRANYFWLLQAAVFAGFGLLLTAEKKVGGMSQILTVGASYLGFLCAFGGWLSAKGSKFWQSNWEKHIDLLEDAFEGRIHKTVWIGQDGIGHSVSRLNSDLIAIFALFWLSCAAIFTAAIWRLRNAGCCTIYRDQIDEVATIFLVLPFVVAVFALRLFSRWTRFQVRKQNTAATVEMISVGSRMRTLVTQLLPWPLVPKFWKRDSWLQRREVTGATEP